MGRLLTLAYPPISLKGNLNKKAAMHKAQKNDLDAYFDADKLDKDTICIVINRLPYRFTIEDATKLSERLETLLVETITYDGRD